MQPDYRPSRGPLPRRPPDEADPERGAPPKGAPPAGWPPPPPPGWRPPPLAARARHAAHRYAFAAVALALAAAVGALVYFTWGATDSGSDDLAALVEELEAAEGGEPATPPFASTSEAAPGRSEAALSVTSEPAGAAVLLDDDTLGTTPLQAHPVPSGVYFVSLRKDGYAARDTVLYFGAGEAVDVRLDLPPTEGAAPSPLAAAGADRTPEQAPPPSRTSEPANPPSRTSEREPLPSPTSEPPPATDVIAEEVAEEEPLEEASLEEGEEEEVPSEPGQLLITSEPVGAEVWLDGQRVGVTPLLRRDVQPGAYDVALRRDGYAPFATSVELRPGQRIVSVSGRLEGRSGTLAVLVRPWGTIYIDGQLHRRDADTEYAVQLPTGPHTVRVVHPTLGTWEDTVDVQPGATRRVEVRLPATPE